MGAFSPWHWLLVLVIVVLIFGTKKLRNVGKDLGSAVHDFKKGLSDGDKDSADKDVAADKTEKSDDSKPV